MRKLLSIALVLVLFLVATAPSSWGKSFYIEVGGGAGQFMLGEGLFGPGTPAASSLGASGNAMVGFNLSKEGSMLQFHLGVKDYYITASGTNSALRADGQPYGSSSYTMNAPYLLMRLETPRFYLGLGGTPLIWRAGVQATTSYAIVEGGFAGVGEFGLLWRVVPFFSMALEGSAHAVKGEFGTGPMPALTATLQMRFITPFGEGGGGGRKFDGWRYPFGIDIW